MIERRIYRERYNTQKLMDVLRDMGVRKGANVFLHSSWDEFYNYSGRIEEFIDAVLSEIGVDGTLAMPAYPLLRKPESIFDIENTPTRAGLIAETFRRYPGVKRSINMHSVCALGPMSDYLVKDHLYSVTCWDEMSPYYRLSKIQAVILCCGLGKHFVGTAMHCVESILREEVPYFAQFFTKEVTYRYRLADRSIVEQVCLTHANGFRYRFTNRSHGRVVVGHFDRRKYVRTRLSNLTINMYDAPYIINRAIELGRQGITVYLKPDPRKAFRGGLAMGCPVQSPSAGARGGADCLDGGRRLVG